MKVVDPNRDLANMMAAPSTQIMGRVSSTRAENTQGRGVGGTAHRLAAQLSPTSVRQKIVTMCNAIEIQRPVGAHPDTRLALGDFLVDQRISNPGGLTGRQEQICAWVGLEAIKDSEKHTSAFIGLRSFAPTPEQMNAARKLADQMGL